MNPPALIIVDVQKAIDDPSWGDDRNNPDAEQKIAALLRFWRGKAWPIVHVRHASVEPASDGGEVHAMSLANLDGEYATVIDAGEVLRRFDA